MFNLDAITRGKTLNLSTTKINLKFLLQLVMMNLIYLMDLILFLIYKIILNIIKKHETIADNPTVKIYVNKIKNRLVFTIKEGYKLELLSEEIMQLLGTSKKDNDRNKDGEIVLRLETVRLLYCIVI